jgi:hypothetical protein
MDVLDAVLPRYDFSSHHEITVAAAPERTYEALMALDTRELLTTRVLMGIRGLPARLRGRKPLASRGDGGRPRAMPSAFTELRIEALAAAYGLAGQFWKPVQVPVRLADAAAFDAFDEPGFAKAAIGYEVRPGPSGSVLATETRIAGTDERARRTFGRYWLVIRAGSGLIRRDMLQAVRRSAERG